MNRFPIGLPELLITAGFFALFVLSRYRFLAALRRPASIRVAERAQPRRRGRMAA